MPSYMRLRCVTYAAIDRRILCPESRFVVHLQAPDPEYREFLRMPNIRFPRTPPPPFRYSNDTEEQLWHEDSNADRHSTGVCTRNDHVYTHYSHFERFRVRRGRNIDSLDYHAFAQIVLSPLLSIETAVIQTQWHLN